MANPVADDKGGLRDPVDTYLDWMARQGIPIVEGVAVDLNAVETAPWSRLGGGARAAFVQLRGRGDFVGLQVIEDPAGERDGLGPPSLRRRVLRALGPRQHSHRRRHRPNPQL